MARKKSPPQKAPEYSKKGNARKGKPVGSRLAFDATKKAPGKAKDGSKCYTRVNKGGGKYTTCTGTQGKKVPKGSHKMPDGSIMKDSAMKGKPKPPRKQPSPKRAPEYSKKGNARKGKPVGSRLAFDATKQEADKNMKEGSVKVVGKGAPKIIDNKDEKVFIRRIQKLAGWTTEFAPLSVAQRKRLLAARGKADVSVEVEDKVGIRINQSGKKGTIMKFVKV